MRIPKPSEAVPAVEPFTATVIYENPAARDRVIRLFARLLNGVLNDCECNTAWYQLEQLQTPEFFGRAAQAARESAVIILSLSTVRNLPEPARNWIETWLPAKQGQTSALMPLLPIQHALAPHPPSVLNYLKDVAARGNMSFIHAPKEAALPAQSLAMPPHRPLCASPRMPLLRKEREPCRLH